MDDEIIIKNLLAQRTVLIKTLEALEKGHKQDLEFIKNVLKNFTN